MLLQVRSGRRIAPPHTPVMCPDPGNGVAEYRWEKSAFDGLRPPGNVLCWLSQDLMAMDDYFSVEHCEFVIDVAPRLDLDRPDPRVLSLAEALEADTSGPQPLRPPLSSPGFEVQLPGLQSFVETLFLDLPAQIPPWNELGEHLPEVCKEDFDALRYEAGFQHEVLEIYCDGSYMPHRASKAGWAFVVLGRCQGQKYYVDCRYGQVECDPLGPGWIACTCPSAKAGETTAVVRAIEWSFRRSGTIPHEFYYDAQTVGGAASGHFGYDPEDAAMVVLRSMALALQTYLPGRVRWEHVKAHSGVLGNEIADVCAKHAILHEIEDVSVIDYTSLVSGRRKAIEMLWWFFSGFDETGSLPECHGGWLQIKPMEDTTGPQLPPRFVKEQEATVMRMVKLRLAAVTYNVSSLQQKKGSYFISYLRSQADACEYETVFLQETRSRASQLVQSQTHFRLTSAASEGRGGVEIWLLRSRASDGKTVFHKQDFCVVHATPEILIVKAKYRGLAIILFSAHAPHSGSASGKIKMFWDELAQALQPYLSHCRHFLGGIDANAHFATDLEMHVGSYGLECKTNYSGELFKAFLQRFDAMLPSTFREIHSGQTATWVSNVSGAAARCDYFIVPCEWKAGILATSPHSGFDAGTMGFDHTPLSLSATVFAQITSAAVRRPAFDRQQLQRATAEHLQDIFSSPPSIPWTTHVDQHAVQLAEWVEKTLVEHFPLRGCRPRKAYISEATWDIRNARLACRKQNQKQRLALHKLTITPAYGAWKWGLLFPTKALVTSAISLLGCLKKLQLKTAGLTRQLGKSLRADRTAMLERLGDAAKTMSQQDFACELRAAGVHSRKKPGSVAPLPLVCDSLGRPFDTFEGVAEHWRQYFGEQEDGVAYSVGDFLQWHNRAIGSNLVVPLWNELPTKLEVERAFRRTAKKRAFFCDGVPGDLLSMIPSRLADVYFPLLYKQSVLQEEALVHKGGRLVPMYKKGDPKVCQSYRSLFISSVVGKALHRIYRDELGLIFQHNRLPMQLGGLRGQTITQASHALQLFHRVAIQENASTFFLFVDVQNAFYRLVRQHFTQVGQDIRSVHDLFLMLNLPESAFEEFMRLLKEPPALMSAGASDLLQNLFAEFYRSTWFCVEGTTTVTATRRGSRPGDSFADLCFGFALHKIMSSVEVRLTAMFPMLAIEWNGELTPFHDRPTTHWLSPLIPIWADDIAIAARHPDAQTLLVLMPDIVAVVLDQLAAAGLTPNMQSGKTEALVDFRGAGSTQVRREVVQNDHKLVLPSDLVKEPLRLVGQYKHLGSVLQKGAANTRDLFVKFACAHDVFTKYKAPIFGNRKLGLATKVQLFHSLVISTIVFNCATWHARTRKQLTQIQTGFSKLYKRLALGHFGVSAMHWSQAKVLALCGLPAPEIVLRNARLRYWAQILRTGQPHLWAMLQREQTWVGMISDDLAWLQSRCPEESIPRIRRDEWSHLLAWAEEAPQHWKRVLRRAVQRDIAHRRREYEWSVWHQQILSDMIEHDMIPVRLRPPRGTTFFCTCCRISPSRIIL